MFSIPEIATRLLAETLTNLGEDNSCTICLVGSPSVGKSTLLNSFLDKTDALRETLVMEYSFGRKTNQKQGIEKTICHVWEYGGKLDILKSILPSIPVSGKYYYCVMVDLANIKSLWSVLEICIQAMVDSYANNMSIMELIIFGGKYDIFKNYDAEIKKLICLTLRSVALLYNANIVFYSSKEPQLARRVKEILHSIGFGNGMPNKEKMTNFSKPLIIPKGTDSWENIGVTVSTLEQVKARHLSNIPLNTELSSVGEQAIGVHHAHPEPSLDSKVALKYEELRNLDSLDMSQRDYLIDKY